MLVLFGFDIFPLKKNNIENVLKFVLRSEKANCFQNILFKKSYQAHLPVCSDLLFFEDLNYSKPTVWTFKLPCPTMHHHPLIKKKLTQTESGWNRQTETADRQRGYVLLSWGLLQAGPGNGAIMGF